VIDTLAYAALCNVPVDRIVSGDTLERELWVRVTTRAAELKVSMMKANAAHIANAVSKLFK
jgi:hypothetical protein